MSLSTNNENTIRNKDGIFKREDFIEHKRYSPNVSGEVDMSKHTILKHQNFDNHGQQLDKYGIPEIISDQDRSHLQERQRLKELKESRANNRDKIVSKLYCDIENANIGLREFVNTSPIHLDALKSDEEYREGDLWEFNRESSSGNGTKILIERLRTFKSLAEQTLKVWEYYEKLERNKRKSS